MKKRFLALKSTFLALVIGFLVSCGGSSGADSASVATASNPSNPDSNTVNPGTTSTPEPLPASPPLPIPDPGNVLPLPLPLPPPVDPPSPNAPIAAATDGNGKLKIFILAGQSNMVGYGKVELGADLTKPNRIPHLLGGSGSLRAMVNNNPSAFNYLVNSNKTITYTVDGVTKTYPAWVTRDDVWVSSWDSGAIGKTTELRKGGLSVGFGDEKVLPAGYIGPEFGFGHVVGNGLTDKVLLVKTSWGGKSLAVDFRPPSSGGTTGLYYTEMLAKIRIVLADVKKYYPTYDGKGFEIAGMGWHQGWNDRVNPKFVDEYEVNLANLIRDLRKDLKLPTMPVVIGNTGMADADKDPVAVRLIKAQGNVADPVKYPEFAGSVSTVDTRPFHYPQTSPEVGFTYHWNYNGQSYFQIGESMGNAMLKIIKP